MNQDQTAGAASMKAKIVLHLEATAADFQQMATQIKPAPGLFFERDRAQKLRYEEHARLLLGQVQRIKVLV